jgi:hypothetical protein
MYIHITSSYAPMSQSEFPAILRLLLWLTKTSNLAKTPWNPTLIWYLVVQPSFPLFSSARPFSAYSGYLGDAVNFLCCNLCSLVLFKKNCQMKRFIHSHVSSFNDFFLMAPTWTSSWTLLFKYVFYKKLKIMKYLDFVCGSLTCRFQSCINHFLRICLHYVKKIN